MSVTGGKTLTENAKNFPRLSEGQDMIRPVSNPIKKTGHIQILRGNVAPECSVAKITGKEGLYFSGPALVFEGEESMITAISEDPMSFKGKVVVVRGEGPKGGPGMPEILTPTSAIMGAGLGKDCALLTDGRFSGGSHGFVVGHICPEAQEGGPIGLIQYGDIITTDVQKRRIDVQLTDEEMAERRRNWTPPPYKFNRGVLYFFTRYTWCCEPIAETVVHRVMGRDPRVTKAFKAMRAIGINENKVKPVLKKLLKLYEKNWELIEEENYRALADAIFEEEDTEVSQKKKPNIVDDENLEEEPLADDEPLRPSKRLRRCQDVPVPTSVSNSSATISGTLLRLPKVEEDELPATSSQRQSQDKRKSPQSGVGDVRAEIHSPGYKGKEPLLAQVASIQNSGTTERASHVVRIRDPIVEPSAIVSPKRLPNTLTLIKPKDEPFTEGMFTTNSPQYEVPIAVIHPDSSSKKDSTVATLPMEKPIEQESLPSQHVGDDYRANGVFASSSEMRSNCELSSFPDESPPSLEIASLTMGEERFGSVTPSLDMLKKSTSQEALVIRGSKENIYMRTGFSAGSVGNQCSADVVLPQIPRSLQSLNGLVDHVGTIGEINANGIAESDKEQSEFPSSLVLVPQCQLAADDLRAINDIRDITNGAERVEILWVNEINNKRLPSFNYISHSIVFQNACINISLSRIGVENCCSSCFGNCLSSATACACTHNTGKFVYTSEGLLEEQFLEKCISMTRDPQRQRLLNCRGCPLERLSNEGIMESCKGHLKRNMIKECWSKCGCYRQCCNRVVQRGINCKLQVFFTPDGKGWGLRTLEKLQKGVFVCEFVGEIVTIKELYERNTKNHNSPVLLDAYWVSEGVSKDEETLCLDATFYGNVARFLNHRCFDANLIEIPVEIETPEHHYYHLAFFTTRDVDAFEELTWDYGMDFYDHDHLVKTFQCQCGSKFCRNMKRSSRSKSVPTAR